MPRWPGPLKGELESASEDAETTGDLLVEVQRSTEIAAEPLGYIYLFERKRKIIII